MIIDVIIKQSHYEYTDKLLLIQLNQRKIKKLKNSIYHIQLKYSYYIIILKYSLKLFLINFFK